MEFTSQTFQIQITNIELKDNQVFITGTLQSMVPALPPVAVSPTCSAGPVYTAPDTPGDELPEGPEAITLQEAAAILKCSDSTIENMRRDGRLKSYYRGRSVRLSRQQVMEARVWWSVAKGKV